MSIYDHNDQVSGYLVQMTPVANDSARERRYVEMD